MPVIVTWFIGLAVVLFVILAQLILPFAFDFLSTLAVFGIGAHVGRQQPKTT